MKRRGAQAGARRRGFTLIELLVAISVLAIVAVLGWRGLDGIVRSRQQLTAQLEQTRTIQLAFAQMQSDADHLADKALLQGRENLDVPSAVDASQQGSPVTQQDSRFILVRTVPAENAPLRVQVVAYRLLDGVLVRRETSPTRDLALLDSQWQAALSNRDSAPGVALCGGVAELGAAKASRDGAASATNGLVVSLKLAGQQEPLRKYFLAGGV